MTRSPANLNLQRESSLNIKATLDSCKDHFDSHERPKSIMKSAGIVKTANEANVGKSMTRYRRDTVQPRRTSIDPDNFRFPPMTPKATKSPRWKLGSGFEGISMKISNSTRSASHRRKAKRAKTVRFMLTPLRPLELLTKVSSTISVPKTKHTPKMPRILASPLEASDLTYHERRSRSNGKQARLRIGITRIDTGAGFDKAHPLASPRQPSSEGRSHEQSKQFLVAPTHESPVSKPELSLRVSEMGTESSQAIRPPSKSERNGWLKRRRITSFHDADEKGMMLGVERENPTDDNDDAEQFFDSHNAIWYGAVQPGCIPKPPIHETTSLGLLEVKDTYKQLQTSGTCTRGKGLEQS